MTQSYLTEVMDRKMHGSHVVGLDRAYRAPNSIHIDGDTMYIAGTQSSRDVLTDIHLVETLGRRGRTPSAIMEETRRYRDAEAALRANPHVTKVVGHSLGGAIGNELVKNHPGLRGFMYGSPVTEPAKGVELYRHSFDPISMMNIGPHVTGYMGSPHSYGGYR